MQREPVLSRAGVASALIVFVKALVAAGTALGWVDWDTAQQAAINAVAVAGVDVGIIVWAALTTRPLTTSMADPRDNEGRRLVPEDVGE